MDVAIACISRLSVNKLASLRKINIFFVDFTLSSLSVPRTLPYPPPLRAITLIINTKTRVW